VQSRAGAILLAASTAALAISVVSVAAWAPASRADSGATVEASAPSTVNVRHLPAVSGIGQANPPGRHFPDPSQLQAWKDSLAGGRPGPQKPRPRPTKTPTPIPSSSASASPSPSGTPSPAANSFRALQFSDSGGWVPPDTTLGAGNGYIFEAINLEGAIYSSNTISSTPLKKFSLSSFFNTTAQLSDPRVIYDSNSGRWFVQIITLNSSQNAGNWMLAVSATSDPTGTFSVYSFPSPNGFPDFPKMGVNTDKVIISGDSFSGNTFLGTEFVVINKSEVMSGGTAHYQVFGPNQGAFAIEPAQHMSPLNSNGDLFMAGVNYNSATMISLWSIAGVPSSSSVASIAATKSLSIRALNSPPNAVQPGTNQTVVTNDQALLDAVFRDGSPNGSLWVAASSACVPPGDNTTRSCLRFIQVAIPSGSLTNATIAQDFDFGTVGMYYYYPALRTDLNGNMVASFTASSSTIYPSVWSGGQLTSDGAGTFGHLRQIFAGTSAYTQSNRWGDYSGASVGSDDLTIWLGAEYGTSQSVSSVYGTAIGSVMPSAVGY
jgi:hypothetical protein